MVHYTDDQKLTIALAELASALGCQLTPADTILADFAVVEKLTAHVRAPKMTPLPVKQLDAARTMVRDSRPMATLLRAVRIHSDVEASDLGQAALDEIERRLTELTLENLRLKCSVEKRAAGKQSCFCPMPNIQHLPGCPRRDG